MPPGRKNGCLLARVNFPLYTLQMLTSRHILVGGGGGASKTGVANGFEIFELSHDGKQFVAEEVTRYETGPSVVMNCAVYTNGKKTWLAAGRDDRCQLYDVATSVVDAEKSETTTKPEIGPRRRRGNERIEAAENDDSDSKTKKKLRVAVEPVDDTRTDFGEGESLQRIVRISPNGRYMATGGTDGHARIWNFPRATKLHDCAGHAREIDDLDFSQDSDRLATIAKDGRAFLWNVENGARDKELIWSRGNGANDDSPKYAYKRLRFGRSTSSERGTNDRLFTLSNCLAAKQPSYLQLWDTKIGAITRSVSFSETLSAIAVSDDGKFVAVGTMLSGSVDIFVAFSLQRALRVPAAHGMFVTGLEFLPSRLDGPPVTSNAETAVVSISVDNRICVHSIPYRHALPFWLVVIFIVLSICGAFVFLSYMGL